MILRLAIAVGPVLAVTASGLDADLPPGWLLALVVVVAAGHAFLPESGLGTFGMLLVLAWWGLGPVAELGAPTASIMLAAVGLVVAHCAAILTSYGPADLPLDRGLVSTWVRRGAVAATPVPVLWFVAVAVEGQPEPAGVWVAALVAATVAAVVASAALVIEEEGVDR
ncbi:MAG: hypothetical protein M3237_21570 [Actinomycetota bacterium]|nr:hypothetical protein [Actinomycetota bacterium]